MPTPCDCPKGLKFCCQDKTKSPCPKAIACLPGFPRKKPLASREEVDAYLAGDDRNRIQCLICGWWFGALATHARQKHGLRSREYRARFGIPFRRTLIHPDSPTSRNARRTIAAALATTGSTVGQGRKTAGKRIMPAWLRVEAAARMRRVNLPAYDPEAIMAAVMVAISPTLPRNVRDDVAGQMLLDVVEGRLAIKAIGKSVAGYLTKHYRLHPTKYGPVSLDDKPFGGDTNRTIGDEIPNDAFRF